MRKKGLPITFIILVVLIGYLLLNQTSGPGNLDEAISNLKQDSTFEKIDSIFENTIPKNAIESVDSIPEEIISHKPEVVDSFPEIVEDIEDTIVQEKPAPKLYKIDVMKKDAQLIVKINGEETDSLINQLENRIPDVPVVLKIAGNVTYAEGKVIKDQLTEKGIKFQEID